MLSGGIVGDDGLGTAGDEKAPERVAVVGRIGSAQARRGQRLQQAAGDRCIAALSGGYVERQGTAAAIDNSMDFCRSPAA